MPATSSVFLNVHDIEKSLAFYRSLGFRVAKTYKDDSGKVAWADLTLQGADLGLGHIASNDDPSYREWVSTPLGAGVLVYFTVPNVDRYHKLAKESGATIEFPLTERPYGRMFTINDPDGYSVSFVTEPRRAPAKSAKKAKGARPAGKGAKKAKGAKAKASKKAKPAKGAAKKARRR